MGRSASFEAHPEGELMTLDAKLIRNFVGMTIRTDGPLCVSCLKKAVREAFGYGAADARDAIHDISEQPGALIVMKLACHRCETVMACLTRRPATA